MIFHDFVVLHNVGVFSMTEFVRILKELIKERGITQKKFLLDMGLNINAIGDWAKHGNIPKGDTLQRIANYFGVSVDYLLGKSNVMIDDSVLDIVNTIDQDILESCDGDLNIAIDRQNERDHANSRLEAAHIIQKELLHELHNSKLESNISAVFSDHIRMIPVFESVSAGFGALAENTITGYQPVRIVSDTEAEETICIRVTGDSMYPKIEDGDIIQVRKQESVDSGDIAVVLLDGDEGLVKRVLYGRNWIELHSINPMYPVQRYEGIDVQRIRVVGLVRSVIHIF
nr:MAG TPA: Repressor protein CI [Caudoviricetes sp.]